MWLQLLLLGLGVQSVTTNVASNNEFTIHSSTVRGGETDQDKLLSVLIVSSFFSGHIIPLLAVGEELVGRGHDVSFLTTEIAGSNLIPAVPIEIGMTFISAGPDPRTKAEYEEFIYGLMGRSPYHQVNELLMLAREHSIYLRIAIDHLNISKWDIIVVDAFVSNIVRYLDAKWDVRIITSIAAAYDYASIESQWPSPSIFCVYCSEDMTFFQRLLNLLFYKNPILGSFRAQWVKYYMAGNDSVLWEYISKAPLIQFSIDEIHPSLLYTAVGVEYARPVYPSVHMVGPVLRRNVPPLDEDLKRWLSERGGRKVVYISMGTTALVTKKMAGSFVAGVMATDYSVVWSLRESNQVILKDLHIDSSRFYITNWVSQVAVFQHEATEIAILHCGTGGVHEALYFQVPIICIPFWYDQFSWANRVRDQGLGLVLYSHEISGESIAISLYQLQQSHYKQRLVKISRILREAGGAVKAANLIEYYAKVGYEHLLPSYLKYRWSWVKYYNVDVLFTTFCVCIILLCMFYCVLVSIIRRSISSKKRKND